MDGVHVRRQVKRLGSDARLLGTNPHSETCSCVTVVRFLCLSKCHLENGDVKNQKNNDTYFLGVLGEVSKIMCLPQAA